MIIIKKIFILLAFLILGFTIGYFFANNKTPKIKTVYTNNQINKNKVNQTKDLSVSEKNSITAQEALNIATPEAILWSEDAYLLEISLSSKKFSNIGTSNGWRITFYSKDKNKFYEILIKDGESRGGEEKNENINTQTLKGELIDSKKLAKSFFSSYPIDIEIISLKMYYDQKSKKFIWTIFFNGGSHTIDAEF